MQHLKRFLLHKRLAPTLALVTVVLLASWMGYENGGYFVGEWALLVFILAALALIASVAGLFSGTGGSRWSLAALLLFAAYTAWAFASLLWSPNRGDAWVGAGQTLLYLLALWIALGLVSLGASRRWVLAASALGPALVAAFTFPTLASRVDDLFEGNRLVGTAGYFNGEAAFLLVPLWVAVYLAGSPRVNPILRGLILAGAVLSVDLAVLTQSRGAMVAMFVSLPVFFLISGQRLRGLFALAPIAVALLVTFPGLNEVYLAFLNQESAAAAIEEVLPSVWLSAAGAGLYGLLWGLIDRLWQPPSSVTRVIGGVALAASVAVLILGAITVTERVGNPVTWGEARWEAFKNNDTSGQEQSRYFAASGSGRYTYWQVAWEDFISHPLLGVGTHNYEATYYQLRERSAGGFVRQPHMLPLEVLGERGIIGGLLFFGFLAACMGAGLLRRFRGLSSEGKAQVGAMTAAITYWFVHSSAEWFWQLPAVTLPAVIYLALLVGPWRRLEVASPRWPLRAVCAVVALLAAAVVAPLYAADHYLTRSYAAEENPWVALENVENAQLFNPVDPQLQQREAELGIRIGDWPRVLGAYSEAMRLNPEHYAPRVFLGRFYAQLGESEAALASYQEALTLNPLDEQINREADRLQANIEAR